MLRAGGSASTSQLLRLAGCPGLDATLYESVPKELTRITEELTPAFGKAPDRKGGR